MPKTADLLHKPHPSESKFDSPPLTWISLNAGLPSQIPNLPGTEDRRLGQFHQKGDRFERFSRRVRSISYPKGRSCCTCIGTCIPPVVRYFVNPDISQNMLPRNKLRKWKILKQPTKPMILGFLDPWFCSQPKSAGFPCKLVSVEPEAKNSP